MKTCKTKEWIGELGLHCSVEGRYQLEEEGLGLGKAWRRGSNLKTDRHLFRKLGQPFETPTENLSDELMALWWYKDASYPNQGQKYQCPCYSIWLWDSTLAPGGVSGSGNGSGSGGVKDNPTFWPMDGQCLMPLLWTTGQRRHQWADRSQAGATVRLSPLLFSISEVNWRQ